MIGGDSGFAGGGISIGRTSSLAIAAIGVSLRQLLHARLRLPRLGGLGLEAVDEGLQVLALGLLLLRGRCVERLPLGALARERGIAAAIERRACRHRGAGSSRPRHRAGRGRG